MHRTLACAILFVLGGIGILLTATASASPDNNPHGIYYLHRHFPDGLNVEYVMTTTEPITAPSSEEYVFDGQLLPGGRATFYYQPLAQPTWATSTAFIPAAISMWNPYTPNLQLSYGGTTTALTNICQGTGTDGQDVIGWGPTSPGVIAVACWFSGGECDINLGTTQYAVDLKTVLAHELGHCVGLGHPPDHPEALMYFTYHGAMSALAPDDIAGLCALYGGCGVPVPTPTSTNTPLPPTATPTGTFVPPTATATRTATPIPPTATATFIPPTPTFTPTVHVPRRGCFRYPGLLHCRVLAFIARDGQ